MDGKKNNKLMVLVGGAVLGIFLAVAVVNIPSANKENVYNSLDVIEDIAYVDGKLNIILNSDNNEICIKQTKTTPSSSALCWALAVNSEVNTSIYENKTYYIWVKNNDKITYYGKYNTMDK